MAKNNYLLTAPVLPALKETFTCLTFLTRTRASIVVIVTALLFYCTSLFNEYALDDGIIIHQNDHVLKGFKGVDDILVLDAYESFYRRMCATDQLAGGRYRPLSAVTFAIEQELLGTYRTGLYSRVEDLNRNGILDKEKVNFVSQCGRPETNYEYNQFVDLNADGQAQYNECNSCWDRNRNFVSDPEEDLNSDGIYNEIDCQLYGASFRHFNNIWLYALGCLLLFQVFSTCFFRQNQDLAFLAAILFTMHPLHSEVVANVKSRDEILSLIFVCLTFLYSFRFVASRKTKHLLFAASSLLLALLAKEYAVMLLALVPLSIYTFTANNFDPTTFRRSAFFKKSAIICISFVVAAFIMTFIKRDFDVHALPGAKPVRSFWALPFMFLGVAWISGAAKQKNVNRLLAFVFFVALIYIGMRWMAVKLKPGVPNNEMLNNPFLLADGEERFCTKVYVLLKYILLLFFPHTLSSDYSYNTILFRHFSSWDFWFSILFHLGLLTAGVILVLRKHVMGFAIATYVIFMLMIGNVIMDIGATMGERLAFHASIGFCIALAWLIWKVTERINEKAPRIPQIALTCFILVVSVYFIRKTWERNFDWKNDITLFLKDVQTNPNSVLCLGNAGARYVDLLSTEDFIPGKKDVKGEFDDQNGTLAHIEEEVRSGKFKTRRDAGIHHGIEVLDRAIRLHPRYVNGYLNRGLLYFQLRNDFEALYNYKNAERLYPNNPYLMSYYQAYEADLNKRAAIAVQHGRWDSVAMAYNLRTILRPGNPEAWYNLGGAYFNAQKYDLAKKSWVKALQLKPDYAEVKKVLAQLPPQQYTLNRTLN
jgi:tetratricopeptide (TPR) repeat protein